MSSHLSFNAARLRGCRGVSQANATTYTYQVRIRATRFLINRRPRELHPFNWTPGIGDPTVGGWVTVLLYFLAVVSCWLTARNSKSLDKKIWYAISISFFALGVNKELDLQSALTELGRVIAFEEGWYRQRETVQVDFIIAVALFCGWAVITLLVWARHSPLSTWLALVGTTSVVSYVLVRAASFHHIDRFIGSTVLGFRWNWLLEMGGITAVLLASWWRRHQIRGHLDGDR